MKAERQPQWAFAIHGGAGAIPRTASSAAAAPYLDGLSRSAALGRKMLRDGASALETAEALVVELENNQLFNAGTGAVYTADATHEMDAAIMDGDTGRYGAVAGCKRVQNPVRLCRIILDTRTHMFFAGEGADKFAEMHGVSVVDNSYFNTEHRLRALRDAQHNSRVSLDHDEGYGTVGAVVRDRNHNLAAATSTGGMTNKIPGRVGDSPLIGAGTYARNGLAAVSATGKGEAFMRALVAYDICARMKYAGEPLRDAADQIIMNEMETGDGGVIAVDGNGTIVMPYNTGGMYRAAADSTGMGMVAIWEETYPIDWKL